MSKDRPVLFSAPMVRALLARAKTQTRRVINPQPDWDAEVVRTILDGLVWPIGGFNQQCGGPIQLPRFAVGDLLYVREAWRTLHANDCLAPRQLADDSSKVTYEADPENRNPLWAFGKFRQGMHMPRWASRLTLTVAQVRVQRLQEISEADAIAEGCRPIGSEFLIPGQYLYSDPSKPRTALSATSAYESLWNGLNEPRGFGWDTNPWVVAVSFSVIKQNIDQVKP
ncbi:hypothetical protein NKJ09_23335 [Mesorhizobium sp. M0189]|uniref:hypothetical protein n=1 Tax=Mesorhizobium sp. M0189 TaxID=2956909 RepID=UPI00333B97E4